MKTVVACPIDDQEVVDVLMVEHENESVMNFELEFDKALEQAQEKSIWDISEVYEILKSWGWHIFHPDIVRVDY